MGDDVRWVGNEKGLGRETEWSVTPLQPNINEAITNENKRLNISPTSKELGSRQLISEAQTLYWYPSEVDVSIRPGWFYHPEQDNQVKTLQQLVNIYFNSVGMNSVLLLNIPPDKRGRIHEVDAERLNLFGSYISETPSEMKSLTMEKQPGKPVQVPQKNFQFSREKQSTLLCFRKISARASVWKSLY